MDHWQRESSTACINTRGREEAPASRLRERGIWPKIPAPDKETRRTEWPRLQGLSGPARLLVCVSVIDGTVSCPGNSSYDITVLPTAGVQWCGYQDYPYGRTEIRHFRREHPRGIRCHEVLEDPLARKFVPSKCQGGQHVERTCKGM
jgi:hypothetical protein